MKLRLQDVRDDPLADVDKEKVDVMMYCTGGIHCDVYSTMLRQVKVVLIGSIVALFLCSQIRPPQMFFNYLKEESSHKWAGNLFVVDSRLAFRPEVYNSKTTEEGFESKDTVRIESFYSTTGVAFARCQPCVDPLANPRHGTVRTP
ncbi:hypothetical protein R1sor_007624 [Riccia sorocarpa]|uniref:Uncharacterized protein n=1 Tax=Riccia sorocarpa TaxID=122646 RepID=A0ABD3HRB5_9MARC